MKPKFKVATFLVATVMAISSVTVLAGSATQYFGSTSNSKATLTVADQWAQAKTTKISGSGSVSTLVRLCNSSTNSSWSSGGTEASITNVGSGLSGKATYGESVHYVGSDSVWLYADMD